MITIGITAWSEEKTIGKVLDSILKQKPKDYEILVVAGGNDNTCGIVRDYQKSNKKIRLIEEKQKKGKWNALNQIFEKAKGDIIILTDGEVFPAEDSIKELISGFNEQNIKAVSGRPIPLNEKDSMTGFWALVSYELMHRRRTRDLNKKNFFHLSGYLCAIKKDVLEPVPKDSLVDDAVIGFNILKKGYGINYAPNAKVYVKFPLTIKDFLKQKRRTRAGFYQINQWFNARIRSLKGEFVSHFKESFSFVEKPKELLYLLALQFFTVISWILATYDLKIKKKDYNQIWKEVKQQNNIFPKKIRIVYIYFDFFIFLSKQNSKY